MTIDGKKPDPDTIRTALECARDVLAKGTDGPVTIYSGWLKALVDAYAATLPREVEIEVWGVLYGNGALSCVTYESEAEASMHAGNAAIAGSVAVRLTGAALLPPREKD